MCLVLLQAMEMRIEPAFVAAGVSVGDAKKYAAALARDGFDSLGELIHGKALDADVLVPFGIKRGHAGKLVAAFVHLTAAPVPEQMEQRQTIFVLVKEGPRIRWPKHAIGFATVPNLQARTTFEAIFDQLAEGTPGLQLLKSGQSALRVRSFLTPSDRNPVAHTMTGHISDLTGRNYVVFSVPKVVVPATPKADINAKLMGISRAGLAPHQHFWLSRDMEPDCACRLCEGESYAGGWQGRQEDAREEC